jgi:ribonuclease HI
VFTDGSSLNNGTPAAKAGIGIFAAEGSPINTALPLQHMPQTNQLAELSAVGLAIIKVNEGNYKYCEVKMDSNWVLTALTGHMPAWRVTGFKKKVT